MPGREEARGGRGHPRDERRHAIGDLSGKELLGPRAGDLDLRAGGAVVVMTVVPVMVVGGVVAGSGPAVPRDGGDRVLVALDAALRLQEEVVDGKEERCRVEGEG